MPISYLIHFFHRYALFIITTSFLLIFSLRFLAGGSDPTYFVIADHSNIEEEALTQELVTGEGGYDGQFFYRYALNPFSRDIKYGDSWGNYGIKVDNPKYRRGRVLYPLTAWLLAAGQHPLVPYTLIIVNLLAFFGLVWIGKKIITYYEADPSWLYFLLLIGGFYFSTARDLADLLTCTLLAWAYWSFLKKQLGLFLLSSTLVLLCRESGAFYLLPAYVLWFLNDIRRTSSSQFLISKIVLFSPWLILMSWKIALRQIYPEDTFSTLQGIQKHFTLPFKGMVDSLIHSFNIDNHVPLEWSIIKSLLMGWTLILLTICISGWWRKRQVNEEYFNPKAKNWAFWSLWISIGLTLTYAFPIYTDPWSFMRVLAPTHLFCWIFLVLHKIRLPKLFLMYSTILIGSVIWTVILGR